MPSTISAGTTVGTAIAIAGDTTGNLAFQTNGTTTAMTINTSQNVQLNAAGARILNSSGNPILLQTGSVLQVVQGTYNVYSTSSSTSYVDSGLSASITPTSSSSRILILTSQWFMIAGGSQGMNAGLNIVRGSTQIWESLNEAINTYDQGGSGVESGASVALNYLDSPATTSPTTYKTQLKRGAGSEIRWRSATMILMEIAA